MPRIIAGRFGGLTLRVPRGIATRPTADRVKEALFSILGSIAGLRVLDLYAGSGALGIEALSRGASFVAFVEPASAALSSLRENLAALRDAPSLIVATTVERCAPRLPSEPFDLVFADPPYADLAVAGRAIDRLLELEQLRSVQRLVLEHASKDQPVLASAQLTLASQRRYGDTALSIYASTASDS